MKKGKGYLLIVVILFYNQQLFPQEGTCLLNAFLLTAIFLTKFNLRRDLVTGWWFEYVFTSNHIRYHASSSLKTIYC